MLGEGLILVSPVLRSEFQARLDRVKTWLKKNHMHITKGGKKKKKKKAAYCLIAPLTLHKAKMMERL